MTRSRYRILDSRYPHFMTATINSWLPLFTRPETVNIVLDSWRFLKQANGFELFGYVILENHLHLIARSPDLSGDMQRFKSYTAKEIIACLQARNATPLLNLLRYRRRPHKTGSVYQVWEEDYKPKMIEDEAVMRQKLKYIHENPVVRGYVDTAKDWRYSSARNYEGEEGMIEVCTNW